MDTFRFLSNLDELVPSHLISYDIIFRLPFFKIQHPIGILSQVKGMGEGHRSVARARDRGRIMRQVDDDCYGGHVAFIRRSGVVVQEDAIVERGVFQGGLLQFSDCLGFHRRRRDARP